MLWEFNSLQDLKDFSVFISDELANLGKDNLAAEVKEFSFNTYTTSSEYLGELRITLNKVLSEGNTLNQEIRVCITKAIQAINKAWNS